MSDLSGVSLNLIEDHNDVVKFFEWANNDRGRERVAFDLETTGLRDYRDHIRLGQVGDRDTGWAIPWQRWSGVMLEYLGKYDGELVGHNIQFDSRFMVRDTGQRWPWERTHDTMYLAHVQNPARPKGLKPLTSTLVDRAAAAGQDALAKYMADNKLTWATVPVDNPYYWGYGAMDTVLTARLYDVLAPQVQAAGLWECYQLEMATARICADMALRGARADLTYARQKSNELRSWVASIRSQVREKFGVDNFTSIPQMIKYFESEGLEFDKVTAGGAPSLDKEVLESIDHPLAALLLKVRKATKICSTYLDNFDEFSDDDGFVHADIWVCGTKTARMSITNPALQTLPKNDKAVRDAFIPRDGHKLVSCDADQIELRLMSFFAKDDGLKAAFASEQSFFVTVAEQMLGEKIDKETDPRYKMIKSSIYARLYGAGDAKIARTAGVPVEIIRQLNKDFDETYPGVRRLMDAVGRRVNQRVREEGKGYVYSQGGRYLPVDDNKSYVGVNYMIQCTAAEEFKRGLVALDAAGISDYLLLPVHDEVIADVPEEMADDVAREMEKVLLNTERFNVPITWSADVLNGAWGGRELIKA